MYTLGVVYDEPPTFPASPNYVWKCSVASKLGPKNHLYSYRKNVRGLMIQSRTADSVRRGPGVFLFRSTQWILFLQCNFFNSQRFPVVKIVPRKISLSPVHTKTLKQWKYDSIPCRECAVWCMTSSYSKTYFFVRSHSGDHFYERRCVFGIRNTIYMWTEGLNEGREEIAVFKNITP